MKRTFYIGLLIAASLGISTFSFAEAPSAEEIKLKKDKIKYKAYVPAKYTLFEAVEGDLNRDGQQDLVLIVKATDPKQSVINRFDEKVDRNRRGIIILTQQNGRFQKLVQNLTCFSSENEDGGVYFAPDLWFEIKKNILTISYAHGRYGAWSYSFRLENQDMRLIGYESTSNHGPYVENQTSINFLTGKKLYRDNLNKDYDDDMPKFKETWSTFKQAPIYLSKIQDLDELQLPE